MKKLAVVLMIMIISLAAVYADTSSKEVQITYVVGEFFIADFQIWYNNNDVTGSSVQMINPAENGRGIAAGTSGDFSLMDLSQVNTSDKSMELKVNVSESWKGSKDNASYGSLFINPITAIDTDSEDNAQVTKKSDNSVVVSYLNNGVDRSIQPTKVATFTVGWTADTDAPAQEYSATITVECKAN